MGIASAFLACVVPLTAVADLNDLGLLAAFLVFCLAVILFRYKKPDARRTFPSPFMPVVPAFGVLASEFLMLQVRGETWLRFVTWLVVGLSIFFRLRPHYLSYEPGQPAA